MANIHLQSNIFSESGFPQSPFCDWVQKSLAIFIHLWRSRTKLNEIDFATELFWTKISRTFCTQSQKVLLMEIHLWRDNTHIYIMFLLSFLYFCCCYHLNILIWYKRKSFSGKFVKQINVVKNGKKEEWRH